MRSDGLERHSAGSGPLHRLDVRIKLLGTLGFIVAVIATPFGAWAVLGCEGLCLIFAAGLSGIPPLELGRRWLGFFALFGFLAIMVAPTHPASADHGVWVIAASVLVKNSLAFGAMLVLSGTTPFPRLLNAMRKLGVPLVLVATLQFMERYRHVLVEELNRMATAREARSFSGRSSMAWGLLTGMIGMLFLRTFERAERVHGAMVARGWDGVIRSLED